MSQMLFRKRPKARVGEGARFETPGAISGIQGAGLILLLGTGREQRASE